MAPAWQEEMQRAAQKSLAVMCPACSRSPDGLLALMESANRGLSGIDVPMKRQASLGCVGSTDCAITRHCSRLMLATSPVLTGPPPMMNTIGIVRLAAF